MEKKKDFNLSEKIVKGHSGRKYIEDNYVKEFIKIEREMILSLFKSWEVDEDVIRSFIVQLDKLAGDDLK